MQTDMVTTEYFRIKRNLFMQRAAAMKRGACMAVESYIDREGANKLLDEFPTGFYIKMHGMTCAYLYKGKPPCEASKEKTNG